MSLKGRTSIVRNGTSGWLVTSLEDGLCSVTDQGEIVTGKASRHYSEEKGRPSDVLVERYDEYKRIAKTL
jgi:uridine phosphorylase